MKLEEELTVLLNRYSIENDSNTPDFILAAFLINCLIAWNKAIKQRNAFLGPEIIEMNNCNTKTKP